MNFEKIKEAVRAAAEKFGIEEYEIYYMSDSNLSVETLKHEISTFSSGVSGVEESEGSSPSSGSSVAQAVTNSESIITSARSRQVSFVFISVSFVENGLVYCKPKNSLA